MLGACVLLLGALAACAVFASEMPGWMAWPLALAALVYAALESRRQLRRAPVALLIASGDGVSTVDGVPVREMSVTWRGPLAVVRWRDGAGKQQRLPWWPDVLPPAARRELRLAVPGTVAAPSASSVAP